jgi:hypoxanthine phosphoribosyltransferase
MHLAPAYSAERIAAEIRRLASEINADYAGEEVLLVVVLQGAFIFAADLVRQLTLPLTLDFVKLASYSGSATTGSVSITKDLDAPISGRNLLVIEDIVDTGLTLAFLLERLQSRGPKSLRVCTLIDKPAGRRVAITPDYAGITCMGGFLVGYGLDIDGKHRGLPAIFELTTLPSGGQNDSPM